MDDKQKSKEELLEEIRRLRKAVKEAEAKGRYEGSVDVEDHNAGGNKIADIPVESILISAIVPMIIIDTEGRVKYADNRALHTIGIKPGDYRNEQLDAFLKRTGNDNLAATLLNAFTIVLENGKLITGECMISESAAVPVIFSVSPLSTGADEAQGIIFSFLSEIHKNNAEELLKKREIELRRQNQKLIELKRSKALNRGDLEKAFQEITEAVSLTLKVDRVSIWLYDDDFSKIVCRDLYDRRQKSHSKDDILEASQYPAYFMTLTQQFIIAVNDAYNDPRTAEFTEGYLELHNIGAMLDVPIRFGGKTTGVLCLEHIGGSREWTYHEQNFAGTMADFVNMALESNERRLSEQKMLEAEERFRSLFENVDIGLYRSTPEGKILLANPALARMLEFNSVEDVYALDLEVEGFGDDYPRQQFIEIMEEKGEITGLESAWKKKSGHLLYVRENAKAVKDENGNILYYEGTIEDISDWKTAKIKLNEAARRYNELIEGSRDGWVESDIKGIIIDCNSVFLEMAGYEREELIGQSFEVITPEKYYNYEKHIVREQVLKRGYSDIFEKHYIRKDGTSFPVELRLYLNVADGKPIGVWGFVRDITERKNFEYELVLAKERAEESDRIKTNLLANMSHEFRTPVNAILGFADLLVEEIEDEELRSMANRIKNSGTRLIKTLSLILELAQLEMKSDNRKGISQKIDIAKEAELIFDEYKETAERKGLEFQIHSEADEITVFGKQEMLNRILRNIIDNALKYTEKGYVRIELSTEITDRMKWGAISVADTGIGIDTDQQELIFQEFRQASEGLGRGYEGTGLGLTISKKMVELMDGEISVESSPGSGSVFTIRFPLADESPLSNTADKSS